MKGTCQGTEMCLEDGECVGIVVIIHGLYSRLCIIISIFVTKKHLFKLLCICCIKFQMLL